MQGYKWQQMLVAGLCLFCCVVHAEWLPQLPDSQSLAFIRAHTTIEPYTSLQETLGHRILPRETAIRLSYRDINLPQPFDRTKYLAPVNLQETLFEVPASFNMSVFADEANFSSAIFTQTADFKWSSFTFPVQFSYAQFQGAASFFGSLFEQQADFYRSRFDDVANFDTVTFRESGQFMYADFALTASFSGSRIEQGLNLAHSNFQASLSFNQADIQGILDLRAARVHNQLDLSRSQLRGQLLTKDFHLPKRLNLSHMVLTSPISLVHVHDSGHEQPCQLNLVGTDASRVIFRYGLFQLDFPQDSSHEERVVVYEGSLKMMQEQGFHQSYRALKTEYLQYQYAVNDQYWLDRIQHYGWDYGFEPERIFMWIGVLLLFFTSINALFYRKMVENVIEIPFLAHHANSHYIENSPVLRYFFYFPVTFVYTVLILFSHLMGFKHEYGTFKSRSVWANFYVIFLMCVGIACSLFILNYLLGGHP